MRSLTERLVGSLWTVFAAFVVFFAIVISIARMMLPEIDRQRDAIAEWLSGQLDRPVHIGSVSATWRGWTPSITVDELVVLDKTASTELARFEYGTIDIALFRSIAQVSLIPTRLVVGGMKAGFERDADGNLRIAGMPPARWPVLQWILQQRNFTLADAVVSYTDLAKGKPPVEFSNATITVTDDHDRQLIQGRLTREDMAGAAVDFAVRAKGDLLGADWDGEVFASARNVDVGAAFALFGWSSERIGNGQVDVRVWSDWTDARLAHAKLNLAGRNIVTMAADGRQKTDRIDVAALMARTGDGWWIDASETQLHVGRPPAPAARLALRWRERDAAPPVLGFRADNLELGDVSPFLGTIAANTGTDLPLGEIVVAGSLKSLVGARVWDSSAAKFYVEADFDGFGISGTRAIPAVSGLDFAVRANQRGGAAGAAHSTGIVVSDDERLAGPVHVQALAGNVAWSSSDEGLRVATGDLEVRAAGIDLSTRGSITFDRESSPFLDFVTRINAGHLADVGTLVPLGKLPPRGDRWVRNAFKAGHFEPSMVVFRGRAGDFPFDNGAGSFKARLEVRDVDLRYSTKWPMTKALNATVDVENRTTRTAVHDGLMYSAKLGGSTIEMPDLFTRKPVVRVQGSIRVTADELDRFIDESPLKNTKAIRFKDVDIDGDFGMTLDMNLGIYPGGEKDILGLAQFAGNRIDAPKQRLSLDDVHGDISFTRQDWYGEGLRAVYLGDPVGVVLNGGLDDPNYDTEFRMTGTSAAPQMLKIINTYAPFLGTLITQGGTHESLEGELPWKVVLSIPEANPGGTPAPQRLTIESSLVGLELDLPWPFGKRASELKPLSIRSETSAAGKRAIRVDYGSNVDIEFDQRRRDDNHYETRRAEIVFGAESPAFTGRDGLSASGRIGRLPLNEWAAFAASVTRSMTGDKKELPVAFDVRVDTLEILGRTFPDVELSGEKAGSDWQVSIDSPQLLGTITVPRNDPARPFVFDFERLWLTKKTDAAVAQRIDPRKIPPLELTAGSLHFGDLDLGHAEFSTAREPDGLSLERLAFSQDGFELSGNGEWLLQGDAHQSRVHLNVKGDSLAGLLSRFNYAVANIDGGTTEIEIDAAWEGMPSEFSLDRLQGSFSLQVDEGRFLDIDPGGGRLFGLLSLQTLPRRLSLDFNDLFKKGFTFDRIEGAFQLDHGNAYTNSLLMAGPAARIDISGRTGLADKDYDQRVTVTPALSDSIPVAGAFFGPAGIGVGAVIYLGQKMFKSIPEQVDKFLSREYSITGAWSQPVIKRI